MSKLLDLLDDMVFIDVSHAAEYACCSPSTVLRRAKDEGLRVHVLGKKFFFMAKEFKKFMEDNPVGSYTSSSR